MWLKYSVFASVFILALPTTLGAKELPVRMTAGGFIPDIIEVDAGDSVVFTNEDTSPHWVASDVHPTHTSYPGSDIRLCAPGNKDIFDACRGLTKGERYEFTFTTAGRWGFHDHLNPTLDGAIIVRDSQSKTQEAEIVRERISWARRLHASLLRTWYSFRLEAGEKKLDALNAVKITKNDADIEFWMRVFGHQALLTELEKDARDPAQRADTPGAQVAVGQCHTEAHYLGRMAYALFGVSVLNENLIDIRCQFGFYHGVIEVSLGSIGNDDIVREFAEKCELYTDDPIRRIFCSHAIGHGLMVHSNYDLPGSIRKCKELVPSGLGQRMCYHGAYMENVFVALSIGVSEHETEWIDMERPDFPCSSPALPSDTAAEEMCYFNQSSLWARPFSKFNETAAIEGCERAPRAVREMCFIGIGFNMAFPMARLNDDELAGKCERTHDPDSRRSCLEGALFMRSTHWWSYEGFKNKTLCKALGFEDLEKCDSSMKNDAFPWIFNI